MTEETPRPRARQLGLPFPGETGPLNAITDVPGLQVGYTTLIRGEGRLVVGEGPVRTGVTAILPRGRDGLADPVAAAIHVLNGNGEMTGSHWIGEAGHMLGPVAITNTHSVGIVHHAVARRIVAGAAGRDRPYRFVLPVVAETSDAYLNDMDGFHVREAHVVAAIDTAAGGALAEGNVGGGTGMVCFEFKGGTGTASRVVQVDGRSFMLGVLVQANFGRRPQLAVLGVPVGRALPVAPLFPREQGSIIAVAVTDAPVDATQLGRVARRMALGIARTGSIAGDSSGDLCLALSTSGETGSGLPSGVAAAGGPIPHHRLDPLFEATAEAVEEAIVNALLAARTMVGRDGRRVEAIDPAALLDIMRRHGRIA